MKKLVEQLLVDIIQKEMKLPEAQVWIQDQNKTIQNDLKLYIIVGLSNSVTIGTNDFVTDVDDAGIMSEVQQIVNAETMQVDILSSDPKALVRRAEIAMALGSIYSKQVQEKNQFKIFTRPQSFVNTSSAEGGSFINRMTTTFVCHVLYSKEKVLQSPLGDYYDDFKQRADDSDTIVTDQPLIQFEIDSTGVT